MNFNWLLFDLELFEKNYKILFTTVNKYVSCQWDGRNNQQPLETTENCKSSKYIRNRTRNSPLFNADFFERWKQQNTK